MDGIEDQDEESTVKIKHKALLSFNFIRTTVAHVYMYETLQNLHSKSRLLMCYNHQITMPLQGILSTHSLLLVYQVLECVLLSHTLQGGSLHD